IAAPAARFPGKSPRRPSAGVDGVAGGAEAYQPAAADHRLRRPRLRPGPARDAVAGARALVLVRFPFLVLNFAPAAGSFRRAPGESGGPLSHVLFGGLSMKSLQRLVPALGALAVAAAVLSAPAARA